MSATQPTAPTASNIITDPPIGEFETLYDFYIKALVSQKYYASRLTSSKRLNKIYEIVLALGTSTAIAGWAVFQNSSPTPSGRSSKRRRST